MARLMGVVVIGADTGVARGPEEERGDGAGGGPETRGASPVPADPTREESALREEGPVESPERATPPGEVVH